MQKFWNIIGWTVAAPFILLVIAGIGYVAFFVIAAGLAIAAGLSVILIPILLALYLLKKIL